MEGLFKAKLFMTEGSEGGGIRNASVVILSASSGVNAAKKDEHSWMGQESASVGRLVDN
jgi:hypothetical protein